MQQSKEARARAKANEVEIPDFIRVKKRGKGQASNWFEGSRPGMVCGNGSQGLGYYKDEQIRTIELPPEIRPMGKCTPMKLMISELLEATPKEAEEYAPKTTPATVKVGLARSNPNPDGPEDLSCADDGSLSLLSKEHRLEGLWAFATCDPNA